MARHTLSVLDVCFSLAFGEGLLAELGSRDMWKAADDLENVSGMERGEAVVESFLMESPLSLFEGASVPFGLRTLPSVKHSREFLPEEDKHLPIFAPLATRWILFLIFFSFNGLDCFLFFPLFFPACRIFDGSLAVTVSAFLLSLLSDSSRNFCLKGDVTRVPEMFSTSETTLPVELLRLIFIFNPFSDVVTTELIILPRSEKSSSIGQMAFHLKCDI